MKYIYSNRDLLQNPEKYNFSKFEGIEFILSYFTSRQEIIQKAKLRIKDNLSLNDIIYNDPSAYPLQHKKFLRTQMILY